MNKLLLMATCSKKILVLGWAPPDKDVDEQVVVDGDLLQEDLLGASRHQQQLVHQHLYQVVPNQVLRSSWSKSPSTTTCSSTSSLSGGAQPSTKIFLEQVAINNILEEEPCS